MTRRYRKIQHNNTSHGSSDSTHTTTTNTLHLHALSRTDGQQATPAHPDVTLKRQRHRQRHRRQHRIHTGTNDSNIHSCNASDIAYHRHRQRHLQQHHIDSGIYSSIASTAILAAASPAAADYKNIGIATTQMIKLTMSKQSQYCYWPYTQAILFHWTILFKASNDSPRQRRKHRHLYIPQEEVERNVRKMPKRRKGLIILS